MKTALVVICSIALGPLFVVALLFSFLRDLGNADGR